QGNTHTKDEVVYQNFLRRSAELALEHHYSYFLIIETNDIEKVSTVKEEQNTVAKTDVPILNSTGVIGQKPENKTLIKHMIQGKIAMFKEGEEPINALKVEDVLKDVKVFK